MIRKVRMPLSLGLLGLALAGIPSARHAQTATDRTGLNSDANTTRTTRDEGFNPGWLGLLGLAGLIPKKTHTVTSRRTGDGTNR